MKFEKVKKIETGQENREKMATRKISASRKSSRCSSVDRSMENIPEEADEKPFRHFINKQVDQCVFVKWTTMFISTTNYLSTISYHISGSFLQDIWLKLEREMVIEDEKHILERPTMNNF